jgi:hypothetical protein
MGRPRKPTAELERIGAFEKHPERKADRANEPKPEGPIGTPPAEFLIEFPNSGYLKSTRLLALWNELIELAPPGVLTSADRWHVEIVCRLMEKQRYGHLKGTELSQLSMLLGKMGLNPADRSKVSIVPLGGTTPHAPSDNRFQKIAEETAGARPN